MLRCRNFVLIVVVSVCAVLVTAGSTNGQLLVPVFEKEAPESVYDLRMLENTVRDLAQKLVPCTVGVEVERAHGSGVIVSPDGYVLTAGHVAGQPGRDVTIRLPDGRTAAGKTLGIHTSADGGLVKITDQGEWPYATTVSAQQRPRVGDWCMALGHPNGFDPDRSPPVRVGRVVSVDDNRIQTDCPLMGGDSGGPLFDMQGRVMGIHSWIAEDVAENFHGSVSACIAVWDQLIDGKIHPAQPPSRFLLALDVNGDGQLSRQELPDGYLREVFDRLAGQFHWEADKSHSIEGFVKEVLDWRSSNRLDFGQLGQRSSFQESLAPELYVRGGSLRDLLLPVIAEMSKSTVRIESDGERVCLGMVVDGRGHVLTKASPLGTELKCYLPDGSAQAADVVAVDEENDLALLKVDAEELTPIAWSSQEVSTGGWVISPNSVGRIASWGVISVAARQIEKTPAVLGVVIQDPTDSTTVAHVQPESGAAEAGMQPGDRITRIMNQEVQNLDELREALGEFRAGDTVTATVERDNETLNLEVTLRAAEDVFFRFRTGRMNGPMSRRRDGFQSAFQHDAVLRPIDCGGPVVDLSGKVVGMNIARANRVATFALPAELLQSFVQQHRPTAPSDDGT